jgi:N-acetyl-1-D-myo-inositol-2-amino-2-deoxy-alpha-D-glucopyranoside deacetylase
VARLVAGEPRPVEHDSVAWLGPDELGGVDWLEPDRPFLAELRALLGERPELSVVPRTLSAMSDLPEHRLLLVHAHPDDETIGQGATMAKYVAEGRHVTLVTCTGGEMGEILVPGLEHLAADRDDTLGEHRRSELDAAMKELGVTDHRYLGGFGCYRDSGMKWHDDGHAVPADDIHENAFWHADLTEAADHLVSVIREVRPQVLVTYDQFGGYGHPDHIQAHRVAMYAAQLAAIPSYRKDLGEAWEIAKIYWGAMSESRMRAGLRALRDAGDTTSFEGMDPDGPLPHFVTADEDLAAGIDATDHVEQKMAALRAHATQITLDGPFFALSNNLGNTVWGLEFFRLVKGQRGPVGADGLESDLFAGL